MTDNDIKPQGDMDSKAFYAQRRRKNLAIVGTIFGLAVLFFLITIIVITLSIFKCTNLHGLIIDSLVAEHRVYGCNCLYLH